ncbi:hypothetical protein [Rhizobium halophytocola]|uniref:hypothetical protein n=1 Tax=Rhizobium halophytocola TaxID=735519 RepID=UPI001AE1B469|nr:hypothetical protein [Rhizobium halophytocola]
MIYQPLLSALQRSMAILVCPQHTGEGQRPMVWAAGSHHRAAVGASLPIGRLHRI